MESWGGRRELRRAPAAGESSIEQERDSLPRDRNGTKRAAPSHAGRAALITFSGVEGGGKSTCARQVEESLSQRGIRCERVEFVGLGVATRGLRAWRRLRGKRPRPRDFQSIARAEGAAGGERAGRASLLTNLRHAATHLVDTVLVRRFLRRQARRGVEVVVFDRYFYDALVRWNLSPGATRLLEWFVVEPDLAFLVVVTPERVAERRGPGADQVARLRAGRYQEAARRHPRWIALPCEHEQETRRLLEQHLDAWLAGRA